MPYRALTIDQLDLSPFNARTDKRSLTPEAIAAMATSLSTRGQIMPIVVHPMRGNKHKFGVFAGQRRWRAFKALIEAGTLPRDHPIDAMVREAESEADLIALSTAENSMRWDLYPYETYAALARSRRRGATVEEIASIMGQDVDWVRRGVRLGMLPEPIFRAYAEDEISLDCAKAFAATEDEQLQLHIFQKFNALPAPARTSRMVRQLLKIGDRELARLLKFVGDAYRDAGGRFELDLFAEQEDQRGIVTDEGLLRDLAAAKLDALRKTIRTRVGRADLRFGTEPPMNDFQMIDRSLEIVWAPGQSLPVGDIFATIDIDEDGEAEVRYWWKDHKARAAASRPAATPRPTKSPAPLREGAAIAPPTGEPFTARKLADAQAKDETGLTQEGVQSMRSLRRAILRAQLLEDAQAGGEVAIDYFVWGQLRMMLTRDLYTAIGLTKLVPADRDTPEARELIEATTMNRYDHALRNLAEWPCFTMADLPAAFHAYCRLADSEREEAAALLACAALERSLNADGYRIPIHDSVAAATRIHAPSSLREFEAFTPTAAFFALFGKDHRLELVLPFVDRATVASWAKRKSAEQCDQLARVFVDQSAELIEGTETDASNWVHPLLQFRPPALTNDAGALPAEAAE